MRYIRHLNLCFVILLIGMTLLSNAQESLKLMSYNIYRYPYHNPSNREQLLAEINQEVQPDILMVSELVDEYGADRILNVAFQNLEDHYQRAPFIASEAATYDPLHQMVFYNSRKLQLLQHVAHETTVRDINQFSFYLKTTQLGEADTTFLEVFVCHLKSSQGNENRWKRKDMVDTFFKVLDQLPADRHIVFSGDFNFYDAHLEPAYNKIISANNSIIMKDPLDAYGNWHANEDYKDIHTQSTRISTQGFGSGGAGGGLDDRFDFIFLSEGLMEDEYLHFEEGSYKAIGNNGNCFKNRIDAPECSGFYSQKLRENLYYMSDHLPVALSLQVNDTWSESVAIKELDEFHPFLPKGNVVDEMLWLKAPSDIFIPFEVKILNALGDVVFDNILRENEMKSFSLNHLSRGVYILSISHIQYGRRNFKILKL